MKVLFPIICFFISFNFIHAQCGDINEPCSVNNENAEIVYNDDLETGQSSLTAYVDNYYQTNFQVNIPTDTTIALDGFGDISININYFTIEEIGGLSATGLELDCSNTECTFIGGESGCFSISGTPTMSGSYPLNLVVYAVGSWNGIPISQTLDDLIEITLIVEECDVEGCWNDDDFYVIDEQYWINNCQYLICEENDNWSTMVTLENCIQEVCDTTYVEVPVYIPLWDTIVEIEYVEVIVIDTIVETEIEYVEVIVIDTIIETEIEYVEVIVIDTIIETEIEYVEVIVTDTIIAYQDIIEYVDCDTGLPCEQGLNELIEQSKTDGKIYNLLGQEIKRRDGVYIEGGEVKYLLH